MAKKRMDKEDEKIEKKKKQAASLIKMLFKAYKLDLTILLRANNEFGGVIYHEEKLTDDIKRQKYYLMTPDFKEVTEFADFLPEGEMEAQDARILTFYGSPFVLTSRIEPSLDDSMDKLKPLIAGHQAENYTRWKTLAQQLQTQVGELSHMLENQGREMNRLKSKLNAEAEVNRNLESKIQQLSKDKSKLNYQLATLVAELSEYAYEDMRLKGIYEKIMADAGLMGGKEGMPAAEWAASELEQMEKVRENFEKATASGARDNELFKEREDRIVKVLNRLVDKVGGNGTGVDKEQLKRELKDEIYGGADSRGEEEEYEEIEEEE